MDKCDICKNFINEASCLWYGPPFSVRASRLLCFHCLSTIKPEISPLFDGDINGLAITGTHTPELYTLNEMLEDGFDEKRAKASIKAVGAFLGLTNQMIRAKIRKKKTAQQGDLNG